ncbi:MFS transporter [Luteimonas sp. Y-2-2-4F]|nr:MFS transporter [Luteimonas sp. Y-2-2-4F]MCD9033121.1 MFS transporter [Luteimonas sp. Y-2-2-4F]
MPSRPFPPPCPGARAWAGLAVLALPTLLLGLDVTLLYLAMPALAADLRPSSTQALWIMDAYGFMIAGLLVTMGTLGDRVGRRRLLTIGTAAFGAASVAAAFAPTAEALIAARAALGAAGATLMPSTLALIGQLFPDPRRRALAIGIWATMFALGMAAGPLVGGALLARYDWGAAFLVAVPVTALVLATAPWLLPEHREPRAGRLDPASVALSLAAVLAAIHGLKELARQGPALAPLLWLAAGAAAAALFVRRQRRLAHPLLDLGLFSNRALSAALVVLLFGLVAVAGAMLAVSQYLQLVAGLSPLAAGAWMGPPALAMVCAGIAAPLLARRVRPGRVVAGALLLSAAGGALLAGMDAGSGLASAVGGFALVYLGLGAIAALGTDLVVGAAPPARAGAAAALSETAQELGVALGVALLGSLATAIYRGRLAATLPPGLPADARRALDDGLWTAAAFAERLPPGALAQAREAFMAGFQATGAVCAAMGLGLAALAAVSLRHVGAIGGPEAADAPAACRA